MHAALLTHMLLFAPTFASHPWQVINGLSAQAAVTPTVVGTGATVVLRQLMTVAGNTLTFLTAATGTWTTISASETDTNRGKFNVVTLVFQPSNPILQFEMVPLPHPLPGLRRWRVAMIGGRLIALIFTIHNTCIADCVYWSSRRPCRRQCCAAA